MQSLIYFFLLAQTTLSSVLIPRQNTNTTSACNNSPDLCSRSYGQITHLGAHDSPFTKAASSSSSASSDSISFSDASNQNIDSVAQLKAGVRLLSAQVHNNNGEWHLCHTTCGLLDAGPLSTWLASIKGWMDANPHDVVTILLVNSDNASAADLSAQFDSAGISQYGYAPPTTGSALTTWPTLQEMINKNTRLVTFIASLPSSSTTAPYLLDEFTYVFENPYNVTDPSNFTCTADRPPVVQGNTATALSSGRLPLVNHFLDQSIGFGIDTPNTTYITTTNGDAGSGNLQQALSDCETQFQRKPTFVLVDYFDQGKAVDIVNQMNGVAGTVTGQTQPPMTANAGVKGVVSPLGGWMGVGLVVVGMWQVLG